MTRDSDACWLEHVLSIWRCGTEHLMVYDPKLLLRSTFLTTSSLTTTPNWVRVD